MSPAPDDNRPRRLIGPWLASGAVVGMVIGAAAAWFFGRAYDKTIGEGACYGVAVGALLWNLRGWQLWKG